MRNIMIEGGLFLGAHLLQHDRSTLNQTGTKISVDRIVTDNFVHTCMPFKSVQDISTHGNFVLCLT